MRLGGEAEASHGEDLVVTQDRARCPRRGRGQPAGPHRRVHERSSALCAHPDMEHTRTILVHDVGVGLHLPAHDDFTLAERRLYHDVPRLPRRGVNGEHHPGALGGNHLLHDHGDGRLLGQVVVPAVEDGTGTPQRRPAVDEAYQHLLGADHVGEGLVHAGKRRALGVLTDTRRPDRDPDVIAQSAVGRRDVGSQVVGDLDAVNEAARLGGQAVELFLRRVACLVQDGDQLRADPGPVDSVQVGLAGDHETRWDWETPRGQLAQVGSLATHRPGVREPDLLEPPHQLHGRHLRNCPAFLHRSSLMTSGADRVQCPCLPAVPFCDPGSRRLLNLDELVRRMPPSMQTSLASSSRATQPRPRPWCRPSRGHSSAAGCHRRPALGSDHVRGARSLLVE